MTFGKLLLKLRHERNWSQEMLAMRSGLSHSTISHFERSKRNPSWNTALKLFDALGYEVKIERKK